jgi:hypothetical protein
MPLIRYGSGSRSYHAIAGAAFMDPRRHAPRAGRRCRGGCATPTPGNLTGSLVAARRMRDRPRWQHEGAARGGTPNPEGRGGRRNIAGEDTTRLLGLAARVTGLCQNVGSAPPSGSRRLPYFPPCRPLLAPALPPLISSRALSGDDARRPGRWVPVRRAIRSSSNLDDRDAPGGAVGTIAGSVTGRAIRGWALGAGGGRRRARALVTWG